MGHPKKPRQQTIEATLGRSRINVSVRPKGTPSQSGGSSTANSPARGGVSSSSPQVTPKRQRQTKLSSTPSRRTSAPLVGKAATRSRAVADLGEESSDKLSQPGVTPRSTRGEKKKKKKKVVVVEEEKETSSEEEARETDRVVLESSDEEEEEVMPVRRSTGTPRKRSARDVASSSQTDKNTSSQPVRLDATSEDSDEERLVTPVSGQRSARKRKIVFDDSDEEALVSSPVKKRRLVRRKDSVPVVNLVEEEEEEAPRSSPVKRSARKPRTEKERARELLRKKRAGEAIDEEEEEDSEEEEEQEKRALYDSDTDSGLVALQEFDDDEEGIPEEQVVKAKKGKKSKKKKARSSEEDGSAASGAESDLDDFVVEDEDAPLGVPAELLEIPLQFTSHSHKPLKDHFRDVVEWCVQYKVNPGFADKKHELYRMAWQKLDDEVGGLAQSKFLSSSWKRGFVMALRARPEMVYTEERDRALVPKDCEACGRSGHPAGFRVQFIGSPYFKRFSNDKFLEPVEVDTSNLEGDDEDGDEDEDGNRIPKTTTQFDVGVVCHANAKTAHMLIHWKIGLLNFVIHELTQSGYMNSTQLEKRERMTPKKKHKLVDKILDDWAARGTIKSLYREFQANVDRARSTTTTGRYGRRG